MLSIHQKDLEKAVDVIDAAVHDILASRSTAVRDLERAVRELGQALAPHYGARLALTLTLVDAVRTQSLPIPLAIYQTDGARSPRDTTDDSLPQRFILGEADVTVPRGTCPQCWSAWQGVRDGSACEHCGLVLGEECHLVISANTCPACGDGTISGEPLRCNSCGWCIPATAYSIVD